MNSSVLVTKLDRLGFLGSRVLSPAATTNLDTQLAAAFQGRRLRFTVNPQTAAATLMIEFNFAGAAVTITDTTNTTLSAERVMILTPLGVAAGQVVREYVFDQPVTGFALYGSVAFTNSVVVEIFAN